MIKRDNEAAFPNAYFPDVDGMSLRDYFAAKAMQGMLSAMGSQGITAQFSTYAYLMADAMLKARDV